MDFRSSYKCDEHKLSERRRALEAYKKAMKEHLQSKGMKRGCGPFFIWKRFVNAGKVFENHLKPLHECDTIFHFLNMI